MPNLDNSSNEETQVIQEARTINIDISLGKQEKVNVLSLIFNLDDGSFDITNAGLSDQDLVNYLGAVSNYLTALYELFDSKLEQNGSLN